MRVAGAESADEGEAVGGADPGGERAFGGRLDDRAVGHRIGKWDADFDHVGAAFDRRIE